MSSLDPRIALQALVERLAATPRGRRTPVVIEILPFLADGRLTPTMRIAAAASVLRAIPDRPRPVRRVVRALTVGLSRGLALARLRMLQRQLTRSRALDRLVAARERRLAVQCPRCKARLPRIKLIKHLWHEHGLILKRRTLISGAQAAARDKEVFREVGEVEAIDRVAERLGAKGLKQWIAREGSFEELSPLISHAAENGAGLCPTCFSEIAIAVPPLPPPLVFGRGRLCGDGYFVAVGGNPWMTKLAIGSPERSSSVVRRWPAPRLLGTLGASVVLVAALVTAPTAGWLLVLFVQALILHLLICFGRDRGMPEDLAIDTAWERLATATAERDGAARFLTRLCLASLGRGNAEVRTRTLAMIARRAASRADESDEELQLLAAASTLQVEDEHRYGRDSAIGIADLAAQGFRGERSTDFAEFVIGAYLARERDSGEIARLRILLIARAFDAGIDPRTLAHLGGVAPGTARVLGNDPALQELQLLYCLRCMPPAKLTRMIGDARTVFDIAERAPRTAAGVLERFPDLILVHRPEPEVERLIGPVLVCFRGIAVGDVVIADPDAEVRLSASGRELIVGRHSIPLAGKLPEEFPATVRRWLRFRADRLLAMIEGNPPPDDSEIAQRVLAPFCRKCLECGTVSAVGRGAVGRILDGKKEVEDPAGAGRVTGRRDEPPGTRGPHR